MGCRSFFYQSSSVSSWILLSVDFGGVQTGKTRNLTLQSWDKICTPRSAGGMGFRKMGEMNLALISKLAWMMSTSSPRPRVTCLKAKYLRNTDFLGVLRSPSASGVGSGHSIRTWTDPWIPEWVQGSCPQRMFFG